jgi:Short C-terminal domain
MACQNPDCEAQGLPTPLISCDICGAPTFEVSGSPTSSGIVTIRGSYLGGLAQAPQPVDNVTVFLNDDGVYLRLAQGVADIAMPWQEVTSFLVDGYEETHRRVTASRVLLVGMFALAIPKRENHDRAYLSVGSPIGEMIVRCESSPHALRARVARFGSLVPAPPVSAVAAADALPPAPAAPAVAPAAQEAGSESALIVTALVDALERLGALRSSGVLTDDEFAQAKARVLAAEPDGTLS